LGAVIDLGYCLELLYAEHIRVVLDAYNVLKKAYELSGRPLPPNRYSAHSGVLLLRYLNCAVIENLHKLQSADALRPFDTIRGIFIEGCELYPNVGFRDKNDIQICVRNPNCIKGLFIPGKEFYWPPIPENKNRLVV
jgi:hypothetical protein